MSDHVVTAAEAVIHGLTEQLAQTSRERDAWKQRALRAEGILAHVKTSLSEQFNDPAQSGVEVSR